MQLAYLLCAQALYLLVWGSSLTLVGAAQQQWRGEELMLEARFGAARVSRRRHRVNLAFGSYLILSLVLITLWLTPELAARTAWLGKAVSSVPGAIVLLLLGLAVSVWVAALLDKRSGRSLDELFALLQPVPVDAVPTAGALMDAVGHARAERLVGILLQIEQEDRAVLVARAKSRLDLYASLPEELRAFLDRLAKVDPGTARRLLDYATGMARRIVTRLEEQNTRETTARARQWRTAFSLSD